MRGAGRIARAVAIALALSGLAAAPITQAAVPAAEPAPLRVETAPPAVVRIEPAVLLVEPGGVVTGSIVISDIAMLYGADVRLAFDPALVSVVDADGAASGVQITPGPLLTSEGPYQIFTNQVSNTVGTITYIVFQFTPSPPFTGTDVLAKIQFRGVMTGVSAVSFSYIELSTNNGFVLSHVAQGGQIRVGALKRMWLPSIRR
ncbi:MAG TPA: cohesin domain-containing protein [Thermoflexales bacterium]|nr:cohesin domain-containing protein [Thermoflexales bacterium]